MIYENSITFLTSITCIGKNNDVSLPDFAFLSLELFRESQPLQISSIACHFDGSVLPNKKYVLLVYIHINQISPVLSK